jgi:hypothetical protein
LCRPAAKLAVIANDDETFLRVIWNTIGTPPTHHSRSRLCVKATLPMDGGTHRYLPQQLTQVAGVAVQHRHVQRRRAAVANELAKRRLVDVLGQRDGVVVDVVCVNLGSSTRKCEARTSRQGSRLHSATSRRQRTCGRTPIMAIDR